MLYLITFVMGAVCGAAVMIALWFFREWLPVLREWSAVAGGGAVPRADGDGGKLTIEKQIDEMMAYGGQVKTGKDSSLRSE